jgi:hypothetical protein
MIKNNIKAVFKCENDLKLTFKDSTCVLTISVGQEVHEGDKFLKTIELVNKSFKSCIILIDDTLQRHTMALESTHDADFFYDISLKEGDLWLERNEKYYSQLEILKGFTRWNDWLNHENYHSKQQEIKNLIDSDLDYKEAFEYTISEFLSRYYSRLIHKDKFDIIRARNLCHTYLVEECTVLSLLVELNCQFEVYPGKRNFAMSTTHKRFISPHYLRNLNAVSIKFINKKQLLPQSFELLKNLNITPA